MTREETKIANLLRCSFEKVNYLQAVSEWYFPGGADYIIDGRLYDRATLGGTCELCGQKHLLTGYVIQNMVTFETMVIGISCLKELNIKGTEMIKVSRKELDYDVYLKTIESILTSGSASDIHWISTVHATYLANEYLTPKQAKTLLSILDKHNINFASFVKAFNIKTSGSKYEEELNKLSPKERKLIYPALKDTAKKKVSEWNRDTNYPV